jgi:hypothetical protein
MKVLKIWVFRELSLYRNDNVFEVNCTGMLRISISSHKNKCHHRLMIREMPVSKNVYWSYTLKL